MWRKPDVRGRRERTQTGKPKDAYRQQKRNQAAQKDLRAFAGQTDDRAIGLEKGGVEAR